MCCCRECWACGARWHANQCDIIETTFIVHVHEAQSNLVYWRRPLGRFDGGELTLVVVYDTVAKSINQRGTIETSSHEEADTRITLHGILFIEECTSREVDV